MASPVMTPAQALVASFPAPVAVQTCLKHGLNCSVAFTGLSCPMCNLQAEADHLKQIRKGVRSYARELAGDL